MMDRLPDTPWHVGYALKKENDPRRHQSRCIYYDKKTKYCTTAQSPYVGIKCGGSAHCNAYAEARTEEVKQKEKEFKKTVQHVKVIPPAKTVKMGDSVVIKNNRTGKEQAYIMTTVLGKLTGYTSVCLNQKVGFTFKSENVTYQIKRIDSNKKTLNQATITLTKTAVTSTKVKTKNAMNPIVINEVHYPVVGFNELPDNVKRHQKSAYAILVNANGKIKKIPAVFDEQDKIYYVSEGAYKKHFL